MFSPYTYGIVFGGEKPLSRKEYLTLESRIRKKIDLHGATPHVLRHTYLTTAAGENIDPKTFRACQATRTIR